MSVPSLSWQVVVVVFSSKSFSSERDKGPFLCVRTALCLESAEQVRHHIRCFELDPSLGSRQGMDLRAVIYGVGQQLDLQSRSVL